MKKFLLAGCVLIPLLINSCTKSNGDAPAGSGNGPDTNPGQELPEGVQRKAGSIIPGTLVQKEIGTQGGEIVLGKVKFVFPAGALDKAVTFKVQQLTNTAPNGIDSLAYRFEAATDVQTTKPVKIVYTFPKDEDGKPFIPGGSLNGLGGAAYLKTENGSSTGVYNKLPGKPVVDATAGTATQDFTLKISNGRLDIANFLKYKLWINRQNGDTVSSTTVVCRDKIDYRVTYLGIDDIDDDLVTQLPSEKPVSNDTRSYITEIYINGEAMSIVGKPFGEILSVRGENYFTYLAPDIVPGGADKTSFSFTISVDITAIKGDVSKYYLVSHVKLINENTIKIGGRTVVNVRGQATNEAGRNHIDIDLSNFLHGGVMAQAGIVVNNVFTGTGIYSLNLPSNSNCLVEAIDGKYNWGSYATEPKTNGLTQYGSGSVTITTYDKISKIVKGTYSFTLMRTENSNIIQTPVSGTFHIPMTVTE